MKGPRQTEPGANSKPVKKPVAKRPHLRAEDRRLWKLVADTVTPTTGIKSDTRRHILKDEMARLMDATAAPVNSQPGSFKSTAIPSTGYATYQPPQQQPSKQAKNSNPIEEHIVRKLSRGRQSIDSRIDLHGMTQDRARFALLDFLQQSQLHDYRIVLVITGKGNEGTGVLRTNVPRWLELPGFRELVNGYRVSHPSHGGEGALYVRLRRRTKRGD